MEKKEQDLKTNDCLQSEDEHSNQDCKAEYAAEGVHKINGEIKKTRFQAEIRKKFL